MRYWGKNIMIVGDWIMYSPDRNDGNLAANPDARNYEERMQGALRYIQRNAVGAIVLDALNAAPHSVSIRPVTESARNQSSSRQTFIDDSLEVGDGPSEHPGVGSSVVIWYSTEGYTYAGHVYRIDDGLLHECFHALRQSRGNWRKTPMDPTWENLEEFLAITVADVYASCANRPSDMRSSHGKTFSPMVLSPDGFKQQYKSQLLLLRSTMPDIFGALAGVKAQWNPFAALKKELGGP